MLDSAVPTPAFDAPDPAGEDDGARARRHVRVLAELAEIGMDLARALRLKVLAGVEAQDEGDAAEVADPDGGDTLAAPLRADFALM